MGVEEEPFVFNHYRMNFPSDFKHYAIPASDFCGYPVPPPVGLPNSELPSGDHFGQEGAPVEMRYPAALSHSCPDMESEAVCLVASLMVDSAPFNRLTGGPWRI